jgi:hypothetical protein
MSIKHELIYRKTDSETSTETERKILISPTLRQALTAWNNSQAIRVQIGIVEGIPVYETQKPYKGLSNLIFKYLRENLFATVLNLQPTQTMLNLKVSAELAVGAVNIERDTNLPELPESEP